MEPTGLSMVPRGEQPRVGGSSPRGWPVQLNDHKRQVLERQPVGQITTTRRWQISELLLFRPIPTPEAEIVFHLSSDDTAPAPRASMPATARCVYRRWDAWTDIRKVDRPPRAAPFAPTRVRLRTGRIPRARREAGRRNR